MTKSHFTKAKKYTHAHTEQSRSEQNGKVVPYTTRKKIKLGDQVDEDTAGSVCARLKRR